jgi:hypothetical protein
VERGTGNGPVRGLVALLALGACLLAALVATSAASAAKSATKITMYSIATQEQFLNHEDDRDRGKGNNPFGNFKDSTSATKETGVGPFAGDRAVFTFKLFKDSSLTNVIGTAQFVCQYGFDKNAFCNAAYQLKDGQIVGEGQFNFNAGSFALVIVGGTGKYRGLTGDMQANPAVKHTQKLQFTLA